MQKISMDQWDRAPIYRHFSRMSNPFYTVSFPVEVSPLRDYCKKHGLSFYLCLTWLITKAMNQIENFRYTIRDGEVWLLDGRRPSFTDLRPGEELFRIVTVDMEEDLISFCHHAKAISDSQDSFLEYCRETDNLIHISCVPGIELLSTTNARDFSDPAAKDSNVPAVSWGNYRQTDRGLELVLCMELNHRFVDGLHVARFTEALNTLMGDL